MAGDRALAELQPAGEIAIDRAQQRRFAGARLAGDAENLVVADRQIDSVDCGDEGVGAAIAGADIPDFDHRHVFSCRAWMVCLLNSNQLPAGDTPGPAKVMSSIH